MSKGKVAVITGSTSGIGLACAHALAKRGCDIIVTGIATDEEKQAIRDKLISDYNIRAHVIDADLRHVAEIKTFGDAVLDLYPNGVDILINNAGFNHVENVVSYPDDQWDAMVSVMMTAPFNLMRRFLPGMQQKGWGRIVNMSSQMGIALSAPGKAVYSAVKGGLIGLTRGVALEEARNGITCNAICPGFVNAPAFQRQMTLTSEREGIPYSEVVARTAEGIPTGGLLTTDQVAEMVEFLCFSGVAEQITGASYLVDGAFTLQ